VIASLIETCKLLGVEPHAYLADVITRIVNGHPQSRPDDLLLWAYPTMPQLKAVACERRLRRSSNGTRSSSRSTPMASREERSRGAVDARCWVGCYRVAVADGA
jgi:hypothetical protein